MLKFNTKSLQWLFIPLEISLSSSLFKSSLPSDALGGKNWRYQSIKQHWRLYYYYFFIFLIWIRISQELADEHCCHKPETRATPIPASEDPPPLCPRITHTFNSYQILSFKNCDTEQTRFHPQTDWRTDGWTDGQGESGICPFNLVEVGDIKRNVEHAKNWCDNQNTRPTSLVNDTNSRWPIKNMAQWGTATVLLIEGLHVVQWSLLLMTSIWKNNTLAPF